MKYCIIELFTQSSTFRNPEFQNFHKSFKLPPPTTIIGLAGAGLGLSPKESQDFFYNNYFKFGIYGKSQGIVSDLWKYNNFGERSIIQREILFINNYIIVFQTENYDILETLKNAFINPVFALTFGNSDSLASIKKITLDEFKDINSNELEYCLVEGNILEEVISNISNGLDLSIYSSSDPICYDLPIKFYYQSNYGIRNVIERKTFSFIGPKMKLNINKNGIIYNNVFIPLFDLKENKNV